MRFGTGIYPARAYVIGVRSPGGRHGVSDLSPARADLVNEWTCQKAGIKPSEGNLRQSQRLTPGFHFCLASTDCKAAALREQAGPLTAAVYCWKLAETLILASI